MLLSQRPRNAIQRLSTLGQPNLCATPNGKAETVQSPARYSVPGRVIVIVIIVIAPETEHGDRKTANQY